ncbi:hypothetical protein QQF64_000246 [Cirrhinus molitorella]|uniref:Uncharacterized protein n=1 Tax=Cirrhinus molitorella TaxID=172907 RepID=A0ABR3NWN3_9TELE
MSLCKEKEDEDIASQMIHPSSETSCEQPIKNLSSDFSDATSDPSICTKKRQRSESPETSGVSVKSNRSMMQPHTFRDAAVTSDYRRREMHGMIRPVPTFISHYQAHIKQDKPESVHQTQALETEDLQRVKDQHKTSMKNKTL